MHRLEAKLIAQTSLAGTARQQLKTIKARLHTIYEDVLAARFFHQMRPSVCPRCAAQVTPERQAAEPEKHECSVCTSELNLGALQSEFIVAASVPDELVAGLVGKVSRNDGDDAGFEEGPPDEVEAAQTAVNAAEAAVAELTAEIAALTTERDDAAARVEVGSEHLSAANERRVLELELARAEGALGALTQSSDPTRVDPVDPVQFAVVEAAERVLKEWVKNDQDPMLVQISADIERLTQSFGADNLSGFALSGAANITLRENGVKQTYSGLTAGEKLRVKIAAAPYLEESSISTWFAEIESVAAATVMRIDLATGHTVERQYWKLPQEPLNDASPEDLVAEYAELLSASVKDCVTADAEVGLFLSGGVDSAAIAALSAEHSRNIHTFTVLSASTLRNGDAQHAHWVADRLNLPNHQVVFDSNAIPTPNDWKRLLWLSETPMCGPEIFYKHELHRFAKVVRPEMRGMLLGAASDEFNGGYTSVMTGGAGWSAFESIVGSMASSGRLLDAPYGNHWWALDGPKLVKNIADSGRARDAVDPYHSYLNWEYRQIQQYNVWHEDRTAAGSGIEARVPFLDHRLVELSARVPRHLRSRLLWDKNILRDGLTEILAEETVRRPKGPFFYGAGLRYTYQWVLDMLLQSDAALMHEAFEAPGFMDYVDCDVLLSTVTELRADESESAQVEVALRLVNLGLLSAMAIDLPKPLHEMPVVNVNRSIDMTARTFEDGEVESAVGLRSTLMESDVPALAPGAQLLVGQDDSGTGYVALNGELEFEIEDRSDDDSWQILNAVNGVANVGEMQRRLMWNLPYLIKVLLQLVEDRVIIIKGSE